MRKRIRSPGRDARIFRQTASKTKAINLGAIIMRGGVRL